MSILQRIFGPVYGPRGYGYSFPGLTYTGQKISIEGSLQLVPVFNAVSQIAGAVGTLPLPVYRREGNYRSEASDDDAWRLLHDEPNPEMASDEFFELVDSHIELWGNAFIWKKPDPNFTAVTGELWPISPARVQVSREQDGTRGFWIEGERFTEDTILHIRALSADGLVGYSPIQLHRNALAISKAQEKFQGSFLKEEGKPAVLLRHPNALKEDAAARLKASWDSIKSGGTAVLEENIAVEKWTMPLEDAQFMEQMNFSDLRVAQMFLLPPDRLGVKSGDSLTYKTTESENQRFITSTLQRRLRRIESAVNRDRSILTNPALFCEFLVDELLRANVKERFEAYKYASEAGFITAEDLRKKENLPYAAPEELLRAPSGTAPTEPGLNPPPPAPAP